MAREVRNVFLLSKTYQVEGAIFPLGVVEFGMGELVGLVELYHLGLVGKDGHEEGC